MHCRYVKRQGFGKEKRDLEGAELTRANLDS